MTVKELVRALESLNPNAVIACYMPDENEYAAAVPVLRIVVNRDGEVLIEGLGLPLSMEAGKNAS